MYSNGYTLYSKKNSAATRGGFLYTVRMEHDNKTVQKVAAAALRLLEKGGPEKVTMRRVAKAAGITAMAIYHYFPSRDALLRAVADAEFDKIILQFESWQPRGSATARLLELTQAYVRYGLSRPQVFDYVFSRPRPGARRFPDDFRAGRAPVFQQAVEVIAKAMRAGVLKKDDPSEVALSLWAHVHGFVMLHRAGRFDLSDPDFQTLVRRSLQRFLRGLQARPGSTASARK